MSENITYCVACDEPATTKFDIDAYRLHLCAECADLARNDEDEANRILAEFIHEVSDDDTSNP